MERSTTRKRSAKRGQFDQFGYPRVRHQLNDTLVTSYLSAIDTPRALAVWLLYVNGEHRQLLELPFDPLWYLESDYKGFRSDYAATCFLSKADFLDTAIDKTAVALEKSRAAEKQCATTNERVTRFTPGGYSYPGLLDKAIPAIQGEVGRVLGKFDSNELFEGCDFGPGVTLSLGGKFTDRAYKFHFENGITRDLYDLVGYAARAAYPSWDTWAEVPPRVTGNRVTFVPKNAKTDRSIAVEPGLNLFFQKGLGSMIRRRLLRHGINLNDQGKNQILARRAYAERLATIDFSAASDTISSEVVRLLVTDPSWFNTLNACRSKFGSFPGDPCPTRWKKFSSMGNGFTFELESLIFYAVAKTAVLDQGGSRKDLLNVSVYGDDVILPSFAAARFMELSSLLGFTVNTEKSYVDGCFYESCGKHYFSGIDVTPIYLKTRVDSVSSTYRVHNAVRRLAQRWAVVGCDKRFESLCSRCVSSTPRAWQYRIPDGVGDGGFISNFDEATPTAAKTLARYRGWEGYIYRHVVDRPKGQSFDGRGLLLSRLRQIGVTDDQLSNSTTVRHRTNARKTTSVSTRWIDLGPWLTG